MTIREFFIVSVFAVLFSSCEERTEKPENSRGIPGPEKVEALAPDIDEQERALRDRGYQTLRRQERDTAWLMQQYYVVLLKERDNVSQDTSGLAELEVQRNSYLNEMAEKGYAGLAGPIQDESEISRMIIFNTRTEREADSLARLDPMVEAGRLEVEIHPWWVNKGANLE